MLKLGDKSILSALGINSGTSADGLDLALVRFEEKKKPVVLSQTGFNYPRSISKRIIRAAENDFVDGVEWLRLDRDLGMITGRLAERFVRHARRDGLKIDIIGSHGQTIRHLPDDSPAPLTLQIGDPAIIARITGLPVVADFRRSDIAAGGEGAPLSPVLHEYLFRDRRKWRAIVNIGGIANITIVPPSKSNRLPLAGDCGPGNMLIDSTMRQLFGVQLDKDGKTASMGESVSAVVNEVLANPFFARRPPKSTGRELFGRSFLEHILRLLKGRSKYDIVTTVTEITAAAIIDFIRRFGHNVEEVYLCGGGSKNMYIVKRLRSLSKTRIIETTAALGYDPDYLEALLWAYLACLFVREKPIEMRHFTGARASYIPGKLCQP